MRWDSMPVLRVLRRSQAVLCSVPEQMPSEERIERWFNSVFKPYKVNATWDVVNTEQGPAIMFHITNGDIRKMHRDGF